MIPVVEPSLGEEDLSNATQAIESGCIGSQDIFTLEFEEKAVRYCGIKYADPGHVGILAVLNVIPITNATTICSVESVLVDVQTGHWCVDPVEVQGKATDQTKTMVPTHLHQHPCRVNTFTDTACPRGLCPMRDAAKACPVA